MGDCYLHLKFPTNIKKITDISLTPNNIFHSRYDGLDSQTYTFINITDAITIGGYYSWKTRKQGNYPLGAELSIALNKTNVKNVLFTTGNGTVPEYSEIQIYGYANSYILETDNSYIGYTISDKGDANLSEMLNDREELPIGVEQFNSKLNGLTESFKIIKVDCVVE